MPAIREAQESKRKSAADGPAPEALSAEPAGAIASRRFRTRRHILAVALILGLIAVIYADRHGWLLVRQSDDMAAYHGMKTHAIRIIDGDTIDVDLPDSLNHRLATRVRLWGVNCPELAHPSSTGPGRAAQPWATEAADKTRSLIGNAPITLYLESHQTRDPFSAVLAHVELADGTKLNEALLEAGLAKTDDHWPHSMLVRYAQVELNAQRHGLGMWKKTATKER